MGLAVAGDDTLVSGSWDKTLRMWNTRSYACVAVVKTPSTVYPLLRLTDGTVASGHSDGVVRLWDWRRLQAVGELHGHTARVTVMAQMPKGRFASVSDDKTVRIWDVAARTCVGVITAPLRSPVAA